MSGEPKTRTFHKSGEEPCQTRDRPADISARQMCLARSRHDSRAVHQERGEVSDRDVPTRHKCTT